jgi:hypothetical protein
MMFKFAFASLTAVGMVYFLLLTRKSAVRQLFVLLFFGTGLVFIVDPDLTMRLAHSVGIGRGTDLITYLSLLFLFFLCFYLFVRLHAITEQLTRVVRAQAVQNPVQDEERPR